MPDSFMPSGRPASQDERRVLNLDIAMAKNTYRDTHPPLSSEDKGTESVSALLDPEALRDEVVLATAISTLEHHLTNPVVNVDHLMNELLSKNNLFEFVFSSK